MKTTINEIVSDTQNIKTTVETIVPDERVAQLKSLDEAYRYSLHLSGKKMDTVASEAGWKNSSALSLILRPGAEGDGRRWMPHNKILPYMASCGNFVPVQWLMLQRSTLFLPSGIPQLKVADVLGLHERLDAIESYLHKMLGVRLDGEMFSVSVDIPVWLCTRMIEVEAVICGGGE